MKASPASFRRLLFNYIFILLIPLLFGLVAYYTTYRAVSREAQKGQEGVLRQASLLIDAQFSFADAIVNGVTENPTLLSFSLERNPFEGASLFKVIQAMNSLDEYIVTSSAIKDYFIVYDNGAVIGRGNAYRIERFYPGTLEYPGLDMNDWISRLSEVHFGQKRVDNQPLRLRGVDSDYLTYIRPLTLGGGRRAAVLVLIDGAFIKKSLQAFPLEDGAMAALVRDDGSILTSVPDDGILDDIVLTEDLQSKSLKIDDRQFILTQVSLGTGGWSLVSALSDQSISEEVASVRTTILVVISITLLIGGAIVVVFAYRTFQPVAMLINDNQGLKRAISAQGPYLQQALLGRLFRGEFAREKDLLVYQENIEMKLTGHRYTVVLASILSDEKPASLVTRDMVLLKDTVMKASQGQRIYIRDRGTDGLSILIIHQTPDQTACEAMARDLVGNWQKLMATGSGFTRFWGIGGSVDSLLGISRSHDQALSALNYSMAHNTDKPVEFSMFEPNDHRFERSGNSEGRLISLVVNGHFDDVTSLTDELRKDFFEHRHSRDLTSCAMAGELLSTTLKLLDGQYIRDAERTTVLRSHLESAIDSTPRQLFETCVEIVSECTELLANQKQKRNLPLVDKVKRYLAESFPLKDLGLALAAEHFGVTESYLSHLFKEQAGANFGVYLRQLRVSRALVLLKNPDLSIKEVCSAVGYSSYGTFARVFKQETGLSAGEYRENSLEKAKKDSYDKT